MLHLLISYFGIVGIRLINHFIVPLVRHATVVVKVISLLLFAPPCFSCRIGWCCSQHHSIVAFACNLFCVIVVSTHVVIINWHYLLVFVAYLIVLLLPHSFCLRGCLGLRHCPFT